MRSTSPETASLRHPPPLATACSSLFLDFDGTLVDLADRPEAIVIDESLTDLISRLIERLDGRVALVSGRSVAQLCGFLGPLTDRLCIAGSHGAELHNGLSLIAPDPPPALNEAERIIRERFDSEAGIIVEAKSLGVAIHYRLAPALAGPVHALAERLALAESLALQEGKMMVELRVPGHDKGTGIATLMRGAPFAGHAPIFVGDDATDEAGFIAVGEMGGAGVLVGLARPTAALYRLEDVTAVRAWLEAA